MVRQGAAEAFWTRSGHVVVQPLIDGRAIGYMILDTGGVPLAVLPLCMAQTSRSCMCKLAHIYYAEQPR